MSMPTKNRLTKVEKGLLKRIGHQLRFLWEKEGVKPLGVESTQIKFISYSETTHTLYIEFVRGGVYKYNPVSDGLWEEFKKAESKGSFFSQYIKSNKDINYAKIE